MKGIIMDKKGKNAIVLNSGGVFEKVPDKGYIIGQEIEYSEAAVRFSMWKRFAWAAAAVILLFAGIGGCAYMTPFSYVDIDINPSIELVTNIFDRVIGVSPLNDDGRRLVDGLNLNAMTIEDAVYEMVGKAAERGFIKKDLSYAVMISLSGKSKGKLMQLKNKTEKAVKNNKKAVALLNGLYVQTLDPKVREEAKAKSISPGKLVLIKKLKALKPGVSIEQYRNVTVANIIMEIKKAMQASKSKGALDEDLKNLIADKVQEQDNEAKDDGGWAADYGVSVDIDRFGGQSGITPKPVPGAAKKNTDKKAGQKTLNKKMKKVAAGLAIQAVRYQNPMPAATEADAYNAVINGKLGVL